jgi:hypothetical protein
MEGFARTQNLRADYKLKASSLVFRCPERRLILQEVIGFYIV